MSGVFLQRIVLVVFMALTLCLPKVKLLSMTDVVYDLCIIGAGLFGTSAARHASCYPNLKVCLIGPEEPTPEEWAKREIFGAHYDQARMVSKTGPSPIMVSLVRKTLDEFRELEKLSGISFYYPIGALNIGKRYSKRMESYEQFYTREGVSGEVVDLIDRKDFEMRFPFIEICDDEYALSDYTGAGHINPRKLIEARNKVSSIQGCDFINDIVDEVKNQDNGLHEILTEKNGSVKSKRILITTGAFTNFKNFHPVPKLEITPIKETAALLKIPDAEAERLRSMPTILYEGEHEGFDAYILPPVKYPDGSFYLKIGKDGVDLKIQAVSSLKEIKEWYLSDGDPNVRENASQLLIKMLPGLKVEEIKSVACVSSTNPSGLPYIDRITPTVTVAVVGEGWGASISEEVGRLAAHLSLSGQWDSPLSKKMFKAIPSI